MVDILSEEWATALVNDLKAPGADMKARLDKASKEVYAALADKPVPSYQKPGHIERLIVLHCIKLLQAYARGGKTTLISIISVDQQIGYAISETGKTKEEVKKNPSIAVLNAYIDELKSKGGRRRGRKASRHTRKRRTARKH